MNHLCFIDIMLIVPNLPNPTEYLYDFAKRGNYMEVLQLWWLRSRHWLWRYFCFLMLFISIAVAYLRLDPILKNGAIGNQADFNWFYYAFSAVWNHYWPMSTLYDRTFQQLGMHHLGITNFDQNGFFGYPPQFAVLLSWMASMDLETAKALWNVLSIGCYLAGTWLLITVVYRGKHLEPRILLFAVALFYFPLRLDVTWGQSNLLSFFLLSLAFYLYYHKRKPWWAGIPLGIVITFKVTPIVILFYFLLRRKWKLSASIFLTGTIVTLITIVVVGWKTVWQYAAVSLFKFNAINMLHGPAPWNSSFHGVIQAWSENSWFATPVTPDFLNHMATLCIIALLVVVVPLVLRQKGETRLDIALSLLCTLLLSPVIEVHHLILALFPLFVLFGIYIDGSMDEWFAYCPDAQLPGRFRSSNPLPKSLSGTRSTGDLIFVCLALILVGGRPFGDDDFVGLLVLLIVTLRAMLREQRSEKARDALPAVHVQLAEAESITDGE